MRSSSLPIGLMLLVTSPPVLADIDLSQRYPATVDHTPAPIGYALDSDPRHVFRLTQFTYELPSGFRLACDRAMLYLGVHETNVLAALLVPEDPGTLEAPDTGKESFTHIWMRFHPARVGELFPQATVGSASASIPANAKRIAAWKLGNSWQAGGRPMVPPRSQLVFDMDTTDARRRFFMVDTAAGTAKYVSAFTERPLTPPIAVTGTDAERIFNEVWAGFDREYAMFAIKPDVDWNRLKSKYGPQAAACADCYELAMVINDMLTELRDLHIWVRCGKELLPPFNRPRMVNVNPKAIAGAFESFNDDKRGLSWGRTKDGIGYIGIGHLRNAEIVNAFDRALESLHDTWGLIVDLRLNGGGNEMFAMAMAGRFNDIVRQYAGQRYREGAAHSALTEPGIRMLPPKPWRYEGPVLALVGPRTMSSAEGFALMFKVCPNVRLVGDRTAGASANPRRLQPGCTLSVNMPRWLALDADGKPFEEVGIQPDVPARFPEKAFRGDRDPVLDRALEVLRETPASDRKPGRR